MICPNIFLRWNGSFDILGSPSANTGDDDNVIEEEETSILPDPGAGAGGDEIMTKQTPAWRYEIVVR